MSLGPLFETKQTQEQSALAILKTGRTLTPIEALNEFGCFRLSERIRRLKADGHDIRNIQHEKGTNYAVYKMF